MIHHDSLNISIETILLFNKLIFYIFEWEMIESDSFWVVWTSEGRVQHMSEEGREGTLSTYGMKAIKMNWRFNVKRRIKVFRANLLHRIFVVESLDLFGTTRNSREMTILLHGMNKKVSILYVTMSNDEIIIKPFEHVNMSRVAVIMLSWNTKSAQCIELQVRGKICRDRKINDTLNDMMRKSETNKITRRLQKWCNVLAHIRYIYSLKQTR